MLINAFDAAHRRLDVLGEQQIALLHEIEERILDPGLALETLVVGSWGNHRLDWYTEQHSRGGALPQLHHVNPKGDLFIDNSTRIFRRLCRKLLKGIGDRSRIDDLVAVFGPDPFGMESNELPGTFCNLGQCTESLRIDG
jgi:hypothetical protein